MKRNNPTKKTAEAPMWLINTLKVLLIVVFVFQFSQHIPEGYLQSAFGIVQEDKPIQTVTYQQLLGTTTPNPSNYLYWGEQYLPYQEANLKEDSEEYYEISSWKIKQLNKQGNLLFYKGQSLQIQKINAIFLKEDFLPFTCEVAMDSLNCLDTYLKKLDNNFELWLALETVENKLFYTKIKVGYTDAINDTTKIEAQALWKKLMKKEVFKAIDNLTVAKPIFHNNYYHFKWGEFERHIDKHHWEKGIKLDIATFKELLQSQQPRLYANKEFIPFYFSVGFWSKSRFTWDKERYRITCQVKRKDEIAPLVDGFPCFENIIDAVKVGDILSFSFYVEESFLKDITASKENAVPDFILNGRKISAFLNVEIVEEALDPKNRPLQLTTSEFSFQLNTQFGQKAIVKMDTLNPKNNSLLQHYKTSKKTELVHIPNFKTIRRVLTPVDQHVPESSIAHTYILVDKVYAVHTYPEFYDFDIFPPLIKSRGLSAVLDKTFYNWAYYINYRDPFELWLGTEKVKLLQTNITLVPKEGEIIKYITDNPDRYDINRRIDQLPRESSIYFDQILLGRANGEQLSFPLAVAIHLQ